MMRIITPFYALLAIMVLNPDEFYSQNRQTGLDRIIFNYEKSSESIVMKMKSYLDTEIPALEKFYHYPLQDTIQVYLYSATHYKKLQHDLHIPDWGQALAIPDKNRIILNTVTAEKVNFYSDINQMLIHELSHIYITKKAGESSNAIPVWFNEGCALWLSKERRSMDMLNRAVVTNSLIAFDDIEHVLRYDPYMAELAYDQSLSAIQYLIESYGESVIREIINRLEIEHDFSKAFFLSTGQSIYSFEKNWTLQLQPLSVFQWTRYIDTAIWILLMPLLLLIAWAYKKYKAKKKISEWEQEEGTE
jgi:hypothetical protein